VAGASGGVAGDQTKRQGRVEALLHGAGPEFGERFLRVRDGLRAAGQHVAGDFPRLGLGRGGR
jgi:hypothetical protein